MTNHKENPEGVAALHRAVCEALASVASTHDLRAKDVQAYFEQAARGMAHASAFAVKGNALADMVRMELDQ